MVCSFYKCKNLLKTNLKWSGTDHRNMELIGLFFKELKAIIEKYCLEKRISVSNISYRYSFPLSFDNNQRDNLREIFKNNDFGIVPVAGLIHIYPGKTGFYIGSDIGYGFLVGDKKVASNSDVDRPDGGFYIKPEMGWHNRNWNFSVQYTKLFTGSKGEIGNQDYNAASVGAGVSYNLPLGK